MHVHVKGYLQVRFSSHFILELTVCSFQDVNSGTAYMNP